MTNDPVIEPADLATVGKAKLLDVRDAATFAVGHAPTAVRVPIEQWEAAAKADATSLDNATYWQDAIGALGVGNDDLSIIYDDGRMTETARVWFVLQHFGARALIVNGGWPALSSAVVATPDVIAPLPGRFDAKPGSGAVGLTERNGLRDALGSGPQIFDARSSAEFSGDDLRKNVRGGHLPGARHLAHTSLLEGQRLRSAAELRDLLAGAGFKPGDQVVTHCDGGGRAALAAIAAVRAGYTDVHAYYLSFADWARDESCPVVRE
ncbi:thiosulfate/3-mercaptopyruvate sulfurtransferase [Nitrobacteraceae bacterium AZCC 2161]